ncbi:AEC family transporter [Geminisphaera colitermitum]|uniref:AEC family transporter n=1 Tax=Geminisphaera colitermitum TaxID=1148786 RepID=UPI0005BE8606|nr:AEC family transporter [Geminisphaera colitermitum]
MSDWSYWYLLQLILPVFGLIALGAVLRRVGWLGAEADNSLLKMVTGFFYPCLIFDSVMGNAALREPGNLLFAPLTGFVATAGGIILAYHAGRALGLTVGGGLRTFAFATGIYNYGYIPVPLMEKLFGKESLGVLLVHNAGCEAALWTVGILMLSGLSLREGWRKLLNPPVCALIAALLLNTLGLSQHMPGVAMSVVRLSAACAIPLGLILIGATLVEFLQRPHELFDARASIGSIVLRLGVLPLLFLVAARFLPCSIDLKRVLVVQAAMPAAILPIVIARHYGGRPLVAVQVAFATSAVGIFLIPLWISAGLRWVTGE